ncbi:alpha/beta hydrolase [Campylobacter sp. MIT 12-5580]|uniref:RBBP9/YdeN family alpha/beta hydrolase n=1 Tax=Campylobacter sp. MIT 12-5580 TaxID=2040651 RepID=UPI002017F52C|nr:alpha/beta hydrolase [Campylobacter sp. MIT 12-5580]
MKKILSIFMVVCSCFGITFANDATLSQKKVYIVHGYAANKNAHWFSWLKNKLEAKGVSVEVLDMPDSLDPKLDKWLATLQNSIKNVDENTFIIGHSLGCITTLRFIESLDEDKRLGGVLLVSGFYEPLSILPVLDPFVKEPLQSKKLIKMINKRIVLSAKDDVIVPTNLSENLAKAINAKFVQMPKGNHFMEEDGFKELPMALQLIEEELQ